MMLRIAYPSAKYLHKVFIYINGRLFWRMRPTWHFDSKDNCSQWNARWAGKEAGFLKDTGRWIIKLNGTAYFRSRIVWRMHYNGAFPQDIDHKNRNKSDDRIKNLRGCTRSKNCGNAVLQKNNSSGHRGVYSRFGKWTARLAGKHIGTFLTKGEAVRAYDNAARNRFANFYFPAKAG